MLRCPARATPRPRAVILLLISWAVAVSLSGCGAHPSEARITADGRTWLSVKRDLMGTAFSIDVVVDDGTEGRYAVEAAFAEIERGEDILSNWDEQSRISELNGKAGVAPVVVGPDLLAVLRRGLEIGDLTGGAFDISFASCGDVWSIRDRRVPTRAELDACLPHVDYRKVSLDLENDAAYISDPDTRLGIAGLAKGYRVDRAARVLDRLGVADYVIDGGGDMRFSTGDDGAAWPVAVAHPRRPRPLGTVSMRSGAIATSGDYEWFFEHDGVRYHHILDPATGMPARRSVSATVIAPTAVDADALATGIFVLGPGAGIELAERLPGVEALVVAPDLSVHRSSGFPPLVVLGPASGPNAPGPVGVTNDSKPRGKDF